jgi:hypothetical protein
MRFMLTRTALLITLFLVMASSTASAATLNVVGGQLLGASGVDVGGSLYNVEFLDGTCIALYNGCDDVSDFTFQTQADALLAAQALLDQVFLDGADLFDTDPNNTVGCISSQSCFAETPYALSIPDPPNALVFTVSALNHEDEISDAVIPFNIGIFVDLSISSMEVYAVWSASVPPPGVPSLGPIGTAALMSLLGLAGLGWRGRVNQARR